MEWSHRFRLALDWLDTGARGSGCGHLGTNRRQCKQATSRKEPLGLLSALVVATTITVMCLPCGALSAGEVLSEASVGNSIIDSGVSSKSKEASDLNPSGGQIWRSIRQAGLAERDGNSTRDIPQGFVQEESAGIPGDVGAGDNGQSQRPSKRPILHRRPHPDHSVGDEGEDKVESVTKGPHLRGHGHEGEAHVADLHKLQSILRDIFLDEFDSEEEPPEDETDGSEHTLTPDALSRSSHQDLRNNSQVPISRHIRSEPEGRAGPKGKPKAPRTRPSNDSDDTSDDKVTGTGATGRQKKKSKGTISKGSDLAKYNDYMDSVFRRMNTMIKSKKMDPLRVNLYAGASKTPKKPGSNSATKTGGKGHKKNSPRMNIDSAEGHQDHEEDLDEDYDHDSEDGPASRDIFLKTSHNDHEDEGESEATREIRALLENVNATSPDTSDSPRGSSNSDSKPKKPKQSSRDKNTNGGNKSNKGQGSGNKKSGDKANSKGLKNKKNNRTQSARPTRGILHGLSSLKREGNVAVIKQGDQARIVRANFLLGPVSLEIMPKKGKSVDGGKPVAATATASKLKGVLEVRLKKGSPTRIRRLRVYPPKNVKVEGTALSSNGSRGNKKPQQYGKVTPMATARLRQIASTVVRQADKAKKSP